MSTASAPGPNEWLSVAWFAATVLAMPSSGYGGGGERSSSAAVAALGGREVVLESRWQVRPASLGLENAYRDRLRGWAAGTPRATSLYAEFQALVTERIAGAPIRVRNYRYEEVRRGIRCLAAIEINTDQRIAELDPELLLVVSAFHLGVYEDLVGRLGLYWLADQNWNRLERLRQIYRDRGGAVPDSREFRLAALEMTIGGRLERLGLIGQLERARDAFGLAARFSPDDEVPRYWLGFLEEKFGAYKRARTSFEWLVDREPADYEAALRLALVQARLGRSHDAADRLRGLQREAVPAWIRLVAGQELARWLAIHKPQSARSRLRELRSDFPEDPSLTVQLAELLGDEVAEGDALLAALAESVPGREPSARLLYEEARTPGLEARMELFEDWVIGRYPDLIETLDTIERLETVQGAIRRHGSARPGGFRTGFENPNRERPVFDDCSGFKMPKRP